MHRGRHEIRSIKKISVGSATMRHRPSADIRYHPTQSRAVHEPRYPRFEHIPLRRGNLCYPTARPAVRRVRRLDWAGGFSSIYTRNLRGSAAAITGLDSPRRRQKWRWGPFSSDILAWRNTCRADRGAGWIALGKLERRAFSGSRRLLWLHGPGVAFEVATPEPYP